MLYYFLVTAISVLLVYLILSVSYSSFFTVMYYLFSENEEKNGFDKKIAIIVPSHNEETIIGELCDNLKYIEYNNKNYDVFFLSDNCSDKTSEICKEKGFNVIERFSENEKGKGYAIKYAIENIDINSYDALLIIDADTYVKNDILSQLSILLNSGEDAIQCYIEVPNKDESWFTQLLSVARIMNGCFFHYPKYKLGLSSYLMGSGICFSTKLIKKKGWTAFSIAEDWEYYAQILLEGYRVAFAINAVVYQTESKSLGQATTQRLRWSSGRWAVTKTLGLRLLSEGVKKRNLVLIDSSLPLLFPNFSLQLNLTFFGLYLSYNEFLFSGSFFFIYIYMFLLVCPLFQVVGASIISDSLLPVLKAALFAPIFLIWKACIDILCFTGLYKGNRWIRTKRHISKK